MVSCAHKFLFMGNKWGNSWIRNILFSIGVVFFNVIVTSKNIYI